MKKALLYSLLFLCIQTVTSAVVMGVGRLIEGESFQPTMFWQAMTLIAFSLISIAVFLYWKMAEVSPTYLRSRPWAVLFWSVVAALGAVVPSLWVQEHLPSLPNLIEEDMTQLLSSRWGYLVVCLLAPVAEELVFRGAALRSLLEWRQQRPWAMIAVSALLFAMAHLNPAQMPHAFVIGLLLGWMYWRTGSILPGVAFHWANNTAAYVMVKFYPDPDIRLTDILGDELHALMAVGFSLLILCPALYQLHLRMRR